MYDSRNDTEEHIKNVRGFLSDVVGNLSARSLIHDGSKLEEPEKPIYDECIPRIKEAERLHGYGSPEYNEAARSMGTALQHHYGANSHHPEHYPNGVGGMSLMDVIEMLADWKASAKRGNQKFDISFRARRFGISDELAEILENTVRELGW
jgi:hypothetical protein